MKILINKKRKVSLAIYIFILLFASIQYIKPSFIYTNQGCIREFGLGYKNKTVLPLWFITIILAVLSYYIVMYLALYSK
mgnify:FL=1|jgi:hypothetical protein